MHYTSEYNTVYYIQNAINDFSYLFATFDSVALDWYAISSETQYKLSLEIWCAY